MNCNIAAGVESDEGLTVLRTTFRALYEADFLLFDQMTIDQPENKRQSIKQGVVTPIGAILKAATGDTICVHLNLAVTP